MRRQTDRELYVYGLSTPGFPRRLTVLGRRLHCMAFGSVDALVAHSGPPGRSLADIQFQHRLVSHLAARARALLPARFGSFVTESALGELLSARRDEIEAALRQVRYCDQMTIRVFGPNPGAPAPATPVSSGTAYLRKRQRQAHHVPAEVAVIREELGALVREERIAPGEGRLRAIVYHLVARRSIPQYRRRAAVLPALLAPRTVTVTGPWPAFAFVPELF